MSDKEATVIELLTDVTTTASSDAAQLGSTAKTVQVKGSTSSSTGAATIVVEVSNNTAWPWLTAATLSLTLGTSETSDGVAISADWSYIRLRVSAISGTGAKVSGNVGI